MRCSRQGGNKGVYRLGKLFSAFSYLHFLVGMIPSCIPESAFFVIPCAYSHYSFFFRIDTFVCQ